MTAAGQHVFKAGMGPSALGLRRRRLQQQLDVRRVDGSLAERTLYSPALTHPQVSGTEFALFVQIRWPSTTV
jgi:hypothetical protein